MNRYTTGGLEGLLLLGLAGCMTADPPQDGAEFGGFLRMDEAGGTDAP